MNSMYFEDFETGQKFTTLARTITETNITDFVKLTGIYSPLFVDEEVCKEEHPQGERLRLLKRKRQRSQVVKICRIGDKNKIM